MTEKEMSELKRGDIVRHIQTGRSYVILRTVVNAGGDYHIAIRTMVVSNPHEWEGVKK